MAERKPVKKVNKLPVNNIDKKKAIKNAAKTLNNKGLTEKQKAFCREYVIDWNATRSYLSTYPNVSSPNVAGVCANKLLRNVKIQEYCELIQKDLEKLCGISKARIINEQAKLAFSNVKELRNTWIELKEFEALSDDQKACISEVQTQTRTMTINEESIEVDFVKIKLYDKQKALDSLAKLYGYDAPNKVEVTGKDGNPLGILLTKEETKKISEHLEHDC